MPRPQVKTYFLRVVERRLVDGADQAAGVDQDPGVADVVHAHLNGDADLIGLAVQKFLDHVDPAQHYEVFFYGHDTPFGPGIHKILEGGDVGARIAELLIEAVAGLRSPAGGTGADGADPGE